MKFKDYSNFYKQLTGRIRESGAACFLLRTYGKDATGIMYAAYPDILIKHAAGGESRKLFISAPIT